MNIGFWMCVILVPCFAVMALIFGIWKEKSARFISGFNTMPAEEQNLYDKAYMARDMRNSCVLWTLLMLAGAAGSYAVSGYMAMAAYIIWLALFFKDVHLDAHKAFRKYLLDK